ncbi:hypothetical protein BOH72_06880 [Mycobacterium sp. WY10]|nr:hypothetical protein BOH72_06880 [Mycobacterium sp. WY10]
MLYTQSTRKQRHDHPVVVVMVRCGQRASQRSSSGFRSTEDSADNAGDGDRRVARSRPTSKRLGVDLVLRLDN